MHTAQRAKGKQGGCNSFWACACRLIQPCLSLISLHLSFSFHDPLCSSSSLLSLCFFLFISVYTLSFHLTPSTAPLSLCFSFISLFLCLSHSLSVTHFLSSLLLSLHHSLFISIVTQCYHGDETGMREIDKLALSKSTHVEHAWNTQEHTHSCIHT